MKGRPLYLLRNTLSMAASKQADKKGSAGNGLPETDSTHSEKLDFNESLFIMLNFFMIIKCRKVMKSSRKVQALFAGASSGTGTNRVKYFINNIKKK